MNIVTLLFEMLRGKAHLDADQFENVSSEAVKSYDQSRIKVFFDKWYITLLISLAAPFIIAWFNRKWEDWFNDMNDDGDVDLEDALLMVLDKVRTSKEKAK